MPATMQGPAIFLAQFAGDTAPFDDWNAITRWAAGLGRFVLITLAIWVPAWVVVQSIDLT